MGVPFGEQSGEEFADDATIDIGQTKLTPGVAIGELFVIESKEVQESSVEVVHVNFAIDRKVSDFVCLPPGKTWFDAGAGEPDGEAARVVITAI